MGHEPPVDEYRWLWATMVRPRRLNLGDLMFAVAFVALGCLAMALVLRSELGDARRAGFGLLTLLLFALQAAQWGLGGLPARDPGSRREVAMGIASYLIAMAMFVMILAISALFPDGAAIVILAVVLAAMYLSTWD